MKKNAIIDMIESDLQELQTLIKTFREPERIAKDFIVLLQEKHAGIGREIQLLNYWASEAIPTTMSQSPELVAEVKSPIGQEIPTFQSEQKPETETIEPEIQAQTQQEGIAPLVLEESNDGLFDYEKENEVPTGSQEEKRLAPPANPSTPSKQTESKDEAVETPAQAPKVRKEPIEPTPKPQTSRVEETLTYHATQHNATESVAAPQPKRDATAIANYGTPVLDLNKAIGINDRFLYIRELFGGNNSALVATVDKINSCSSYDEAHALIAQNFQWDETDPTVEAFLKAVHRRFL